MTTTDKRCTRRPILISLRVKSSIPQDEHLDILSKLVPMLTMPHVIEVRFHVHKKNVAILKPETAGILGSLSSSLV